MCVIPEILDTYFNSHAHVERDLDVGAAVIYAVQNFNSHAHVERDLKFGLKFFLRYHFNSHAHVERDKGTVSAINSRLKFQLTRSRGA